MQIPLPPNLKSKRRVSTMTDPRNSMGSFQSTTKAAAKRGTFVDKKSMHRDTTFLAKVLEKERNKSIKSLPDAKMKKR